MSSIIISCLINQQKLQDQIRIQDYQPSQNSFEKKNNQDGLYQKQQQNNQNHCHLYKIHEIYNKKELKQVERHVQNQFKHMDNTFNSSIQNHIKHNNNKIDQINKSTSNNHYEYKLCILGLALLFSLLMFTFFIQGLILVNETINQSPTQKEKNQFQNKKYQGIEKEINQNSQQRQKAQSKLYEKKRQYILENSPFSFFYQIQIRNYHLQNQQIDTRQQLNRTLKFWMMTSKNIQENQELKKFAQAQKDYFEKKYQIQKYGEIQICVLVLSYMNEANDRYKRNLDSIFQQQYENYKIYYVDDYSKDRTAELVETYIKSNKLEDKIKLYKNTQKKGKSYNQFYIGQENCKPGSVMVVVDGDDELIGRQVFKFLSAVYQQTQLYYIYTHSVLICQRKKVISRGYSIPMKKQIVKATNYRNWYLPSHLRTWMSDLFLDIKKEDLFINETFPEVAEDVGSSFQLMQKAGTKVGFINQYIYRYVMETGYNDYSISKQKQIQVDNYYRKLPKFPTYDKNITYNVKDIKQD